MVNTSENRLDRFLKAACAVLIVFIAAQVAIQLASFPRYYQRVSNGEVPTVRAGGEVVMSNEVMAERAAVRGMTRPGYALYSIALNLAHVAGFGGVAALILWKARREWFHWFTALVLLFYPTGGLWEVTQVAQLGYNFVALGGLLWPSFLLFLYLFPNGRGVPHWTWWLMGPIAVIHLALQAAGLAAEYGWLRDEGLLATISELFVAVVAGFFVILLAQVYRYWRGSTPAERAQTRWFVAGLALWLVVSSFTEPDSGAALRTAGLLGDVGELFSLVIPLAIGIAILRYRLYDIDLIIRRTLIYGALTGALGATYLGSVVLLQRLVGGQAGQMPPWVIVVSTLIIAALFRPLHSRIQRAIDRRFYRRRYNAQETLGAFAAKLRAPEHAALDKLTGELLEVIGETMQPAHASLWLRKVPGQGGAKRAEPDSPG